MYSRFLKYAMYGAVLNILFTPIVPGIARYFGYAAILFTVLYPVLLSCREGKLRLNKAVLWLMAAVILSGLFSLGGFKAEKLVDQLVPPVSFVAFYWALTMEPDRMQVLDLRDIFRANYVLCAIFLLYTFGPFDFRYVEANQWGAVVFTMGLGNPNAVALYVMASLVLLILQVLNTSNRIHRVLNFCLMALLVYILILLKSRAVLFCALAVVLFFLLRRRRIGKRMAYLLLLVPVMMVVVQMLISRLDLNILILGKAMDTGRAELYRDFLQELKENPEQIFFGRLFSYDFKNLHNAPLSIFAALGLFGLVPVCMIWVRQVRLLGAGCKDRTQLVAFAAVLAFVVHSSAEAMSMVGTVPYSIFILIIVQTAKGNIRYMPEKL